MQLTSTRLCGCGCGQEVRTRWAVDRETGQVYKVRYARGHHMKIHRAPRNRATITEATAARIKGLLAETNMTHREIAQLCSTTRAVVGEINRGRNWVWVPRAYLYPQYLPGLKAARKRVGMAQMDLAREALGGYTNTHISAFENLKRRAAPETMQKLAAALDVTIEELITAPVPCETQALAV